MPGNRARAVLLVAVAVLLAGCGPSGALRVEGPAPTPRPRVSPLDPQDLRNIRNVDVRTTLLTDPGVDPMIKDVIRRCQLCGLDTPVYTDVTGDTYDDLVIPVNGANGGPWATYVYSVQDGRLRQVFGVTGVGVGVEPGDEQLIVRQDLYAPDDAHCCPSGRETIRYRWDGQRFVEVSRHGDRPGLAPYGRAGR